MTRAEKKVLSQSCDLANAMAALPTPKDRRYKHDVEDAYFHIRAIQNIIMARGTMRRNPVKK